MRDPLKQKANAMLGIATGINFLAGLLYIWSVIAKGLVEKWGWTSTQASLPYTVALVSFVVTMALAGPLQDRKGPRLTGTLAGLLMGLGLILSSLTKNPTLIALTFGVIAGAGIGLSNVSTSPPAVKWFPASQKGIVTGVVAAGVGIASAFYAPFADFCIRTFGIDATFLALGVGILVLVLTLAQFLKNPPAGYPPVEAPRADAAKAAHHAVAADADWRVMLRRLDFWRLWVMMAFSSTAGLMIIGHAAKIVKLQAHWDGGFLLVVLLAFFNAGGRVLGGWVSDRLGRIVLLRLVFLGLAATMCLFPLFTSIPLLAVGTALTGLFYGALFAVFPSTLIERYGVKNYGSNYGLLMTAWGTGGVIGPMVAAAVVDGTKTYFWDYYVAAALCVVAILVSLTFRKTATVRPANAQGA
jgi:MFS family permease